MRKLINEYGKLIISLIIMFAVIASVVGGGWLNMVGDSLDMNLKEPSNISLKDADAVSYATLKPYIEVKSVTLQTGESVKLKSLIKAYKNGNTSDESTKISNDCITVTCNSSSYNKTSDLFTAETSGSFSVNYKVKTTQTIDGELQNIVGYASTTILVDNDNISSDSSHTLSIVQDTTYVLNDMNIKYKKNNVTLKNGSKLKAGTEVHISYDDSSDDYQYIKTTLKYLSIEEIKKEIIFENGVTSFIIPFDIGINSDITLEYQYKTIPTLKPSKSSSTGFCLSTAMTACNVNAKTIKGVVFSNKKIDNYNDYLISSDTSNFYNFSSDSSCPIYARISNNILSFHSETGTFKFNQYCNYLFCNFNNIEYISCSDNKTVDFSQVLYCNNIFSNCYELKNIGFGFDYTYSSELPYQNIAHINFPNLQEATNMFSDCYKLQIFDMTGCEKLTMLPGLHNCIGAKQLLIEYQAAKIIPDNAKCLDYSAIEKFGMSLFVPSSFWKIDWYTDKIIENYNIKVINDTSSNINVNRFHIKIINHPNYTSQPGTIHMNINNEVSMLNGLRYDEELGQKVRSWYEANNYFSYISLYYNNNACSDCGFNPMVNYLETYGPNQSNITELQKIGTDSYTCPNCGTTINYTTNYHINKTNGIRYIYGYIVVGAYSE